MRFTYADDLSSEPRPSTLVRWSLRTLTFILAGMAVLAAYELVTFVQDYWRALHG
jgi:hypothetical protein